MLVSGYSGIGKTSLIHELYKPIVRQRGYFITGKFDQVVRNIPYGAFTQALRSLVWQLLTESEDRLAQWRGRLSDALGANGGVLAEVIPEIELILGTQAAPPPLDPTETRNRFGYVFQQFVGALSDREHPLVVFLDDLQWADAATLDLLHALLTAPDIHDLLLIGAYRDNEVDAGHLLTWAINKLESAGARVSRVWLGPLAMPDLTAFVSDTLHREPADVDALAGLIRSKTDGNPFFVIQFLKTLEQEGHFVFDPERTGWSFRMDAIAAAGITDNVVDLMTRKIRRLSAHAQQALTLAACIGNQFDWNTYVTVSRQPPGGSGQRIGRSRGRRSHPEIGRPVRTVDLGRARPRQLLVPARPRAAGRLWPDPGRAEETGPPRCGPPVAGRPESGRGRRSHLHHHQPSERRRRSRHGPERAAVSRAAQPRGRTKGQGLRGLSRGGGVLRQRASRSSTRPGGARNTS